MSKKKTEYERVRDVWYKRLKDEGFKDIEYGDYAESQLPYFLRTPDPGNDLKVQIIQEYYCMATHFLNEYQFNTELDKIMWEYHTNAISARDISKLLKDAGVAKISRDRVWVRIKKLEKIMKGLYLSV